MISEEESKRIIQEIVGKMRKMQVLLVGERGLLSSLIREELKKYCDLTVISTKDYVSSEGFDVTIPLGFFDDSFYETAEKDSVVLSTEPRKRFDGKYVYGNKAFTKIKKGDHVANPGCMSTLLISMLQILHNSCYSPKITKIKAYGSLSMGGHKVMERGYVSDRVLRNDNHLNEAKMFYMRGGMIELWFDIEKESDPRQLFHHGWIAKKEDISVKNGAGKPGFLYYKEDGYMAACFDNLLMGARDTLAENIVMINRYHDYYKRK
jgi:hypothetical protein